MHYALTVTPVEPNGHELPSTTYVLSQQDMDHPDCGELLRPLILDWVDVAREIEEIDEFGRRLDRMSEAERAQLGLGRVTSKTITSSGEVSA